VPVTRTIAGPAVGPADPPRPVTVAIIDPQPVTRLGLEQVLSLHPGIKVVATAGRSAELTPPPQHPDVTLLALPATDRAADIGLVLRTCDDRSAVLVILGGDCTVSALFSEAVRRRVSGAVSREAQPEEILFAIEAAVRGGWYLSAELTTRFRSGGVTQAQPRPALTPRETETAVLLAAGLTHRQIAGRLGLTGETVNTYVKRMRAKFNVGNKAALTSTLIQQGYITTDTVPITRHPDKCKQD
jgi:DNA-binding NarL/FixJ family response regulator